MSKITHCLYVDSEWEQIIHMNGSFSLSHLLTQNVTVLNSRSLSRTNGNSENEMTGTGYTFLGL